MKYLIRCNEEPVCLPKFRKNPIPWQEVPSEDKGLIWVKLDQMQSGFCAFCEQKLPPHKRHIEHFFSRSSHRSRTFDWSNLFGSCESSVHCAHYKDSHKVKPYNPNQLIKPDEDDPNDYFTFLPDGTISPNLVLSPQSKRKAEETIRVFGLNDTTLISIRRNILKKYQNLYDKCYKELIQCGDQQMIIDALNEYSPKGQQGGMYISSLILNRQPISTTKR